MQISIVGTDSVSVKMPKTELDALVERMEKIPELGQSGDFVLQRAAEALGRTERQDDNSYVGRMNFWETRALLLVRALRGVRIEGDEVAQVEFYDEILNTED